MAEVPKSEERPVSLWKRLKKLLCPHLRYSEKPQSMREEMQGVRTWTCEYCGHSMTIDEDSHPVIESHW